MWYAVVITNSITNRQFLRVSQDYIADWIEILQTYHSPTTLQELSTGDQDLFKLIADMRETDNITAYRLQLHYADEEPLSIMQRMLLSRQISGEDMVKPLNATGGRRNYVVSRYTTNGEWLGTYHNVEEAGKLLNIKPRNIYKALESGGTCNGYVWKWRAGDVWTENA